MVMKHAWISPSGRNFSFMLYWFLHTFWNYVFECKLKKLCINLCFLTYVLKGSIFEFFIFYVYLWFVSVVPTYGFWIAKQVNGKIIILIKKSTYCNGIFKVNRCNMWNLLQRKSSVALTYCLGLYYNGLHWLFCHCNNTLLQWH